MTPEQKAQQEIDRRLTQCGWIVQSHREMNISAGVAVREFPLKGVFADYLLYADGRAVGVVEPTTEPPFRHPAFRHSPAATTADNRIGGGRE